MRDVKHTAVLGAGTIGASWTALFLAAGHSVAVFDPRADAKARVMGYVENAWPTLEALGMATQGAPDAVTFHPTAAAAVAGADFVQENVPERLAIKHATFAEIEPVLEGHSIVASSASGLTLSQMQGGWKNPSNLVLGHPFNPPHLIPLVEVMGNAHTKAGVVERARAFYEAVGKTTIQINKEKNGHVANRLQAALWREAVSLVVEGVASVEDVDKAVWAGPGLRWAAMGPTSLFHLGAGDGGLQAFLTHFEDTFNGWWDDLGHVRLGEGVSHTLVQGMTQAAHGQSVAEMAATRDALVLAMLQARKSIDR